MTMPHLMNCSHQGSGWCLECVKGLQEDRDKVECVLMQIEDIANNYVGYGGEPTTLEGWIEEYNECLSIIAKRAADVIGFHIVLLSTENE